MTYLIYHKISDAAAVRYQLERMRIKRTAALVLAFVCGLLVVLSALVSSYAPAFEEANQPVTSVAGQPSVALAQPD